MALVWQTAKAQSARVIFFRASAPFRADVYKHKIEIVDGEDVQYARPNTVYLPDHAIIGKTGPRSVLVYNYIAPTPAFYTGHHKKDLFKPADSVQFVRVINKTSFSLHSRFWYKTYTTEQFKAYYAHKKWLRKKLAKKGYKSVEDLMKG